MLFIKYIISLFTNFKPYLLALIGSLLLSGLLYTKNLRLENSLQACNGKLAAQQAAINIANEMRSRQEQQLRLREREVSKAQADVQKQLERVRDAKLPDDCQKAADLLIEYGR